ncbi:MAG: DUF6152 family protein [Steroidobacteraceae bacterium]
MKIRITTAAALLACAGWGVASAHHSFATFDQHTTKTIVGTVKDFQWTNPHIWVDIIVKSPQTGKDEVWSIEGGSPNGLRRTGWTRGTMKQGDTIEVVIHPLKNGANGGSMMTAKVNGQPIGRRF